MVGVDSSSGSSAEDHKALQIALLERHDSVSWNACGVNSQIPKHVPFQTLVFPTSTTQQEEKKIQKRTFQKRQSVSHHCDLSDFFKDSFNKLNEPLSYVDDVPRWRPDVPHLGTGLFF